MELQADPHTEDSGGTAEGHEQWRKVRQTHVYSLENFQGLMRRLGAENATVAKSLTFTLPCAPKNNLSALVEEGITACGFEAHKTYYNALFGAKKEPFSYANEATKEMIEHLQLLSSIGYVSGATLGGGSKRSSKHGYSGFYFKLEMWGLGLFGLVRDLRDPRIRTLPIQWVGGATTTPEKVAAAVGDFTLGILRDLSTPSSKRETFSLDECMNEFQDPDLCVRYKAEFTQFELYATKGGLRGTFDDEWGTECDVIHLAEHQYAEALAMQRLEDNEVFRGGILAEEMGLGKTATLFALICYRRWLKVLGKEVTNAGVQSRGVDKGKKRASSSSEDGGASSSASFNPMLRPHDDWNKDAVLDVFVGWDTTEAGTRPNYHTLNTTGGDKAIVWQGDRSPYLRDRSLPGTQVQFIAPNTTLFLTSLRLIEQVSVEFSRWTRLKVRKLTSKDLTVRNERQHKTLLESIASQDLVVISFEDAFKSMHLGMKYPWPSEPTHNLSIGQQVTIVHPLKTELRVEATIEGAIRGQGVPQYKVRYKDPDTRQFKHTTVSADDVRFKRDGSTPVDALLSIRFERCVIDELQDSNTTFKIELAYLIACKYRWCISGTPFATAEDVQGTLKFLRHPLAELFTLAYIRAVDRGPDMKAKLLYHVGSGILGPITLRRFPRAAISREKMTALKIQVSIRAPQNLDGERLPDKVKALMNKQGNDDGYMVSVHSEDQIGEYNKLLRDYCRIPTYETKEGLVVPKEAHAGDLTLKIRRPEMSHVLKLLHCSLTRSDDFFFSHKHKILRDILAPIVKKGEKAAVFVWSIRKPILQFLQTFPQVGEAHEPGIKAVKYTNTAGFLKKTDWNVVVVDFKRDACGLNLQAANHVIFMAPYTESWRVDQAIGRVLRMGQKKDVILWFLTSNNPLERECVTRLLCELYDDRGLSYSRADYGAREARGEDITASGQTDGDNQVVAEPNGGDDQAAEDHTKEDSEEEENLNDGREIPTSATSLILFAAGRHVGFMEGKGNEPSKQGTGYKDLKDLDKELCRLKSYVIVTKYPPPDGSGPCGRFAGQLERPHGEPWRIVCGKIFRKDGGKTSSYHFHKNHKDGKADLQGRTSKERKEASSAAKRAMVGDFRLTYNTLGDLREPERPRHIEVRKSGAAGGRFTPRSNTLDDLVRLRSIMAPLARQLARRDQAPEASIVYDEHYSITAETQIDTYRKLPGKLDGVIDDLTTERKRQLSLLYLGATHDVTERFKEHFPRLGGGLFHEMYVIASLVGDNKKALYNFSSGAEEQLINHLIKKYEWSPTVVNSLEREDAIEAFLEFCDDPGCDTRVYNKVEASKGLTKDQDSYFIYLNVRFKQAAV